MYDKLVDGTERGGRDPIGVFVKSDRSGELM